MALSDREERMLLTIFEQARDEARAIEARWRAEPVETHEDGPEALAYEVAFATGAAHGSDHALSMLKAVLDG